MPDRYPPDDPREWLNRARSNLVIARNDKRDDIYFEDLCYNAQQAAEKTIKAVFVCHRIPYPYIHDLAALVTILMENCVTVPDSVKESAKLTRFAIVTRYPHALQPITETEYRRAVSIAEEVFRWGEKDISKK